MTTYALIDLNYRWSTVNFKWCVSVGGKKYTSKPLSIILFLIKEELHNCYYKSMDHNDNEHWECNKTQKHLNWNMTNSHTDED